MNSQKISRPQILNVYKFNRTVAQQHKRAPLRQVLNRFRRSRLFQLLLACSLILLSVFFGIFGAFGTAAITLLCALSEIVSQLITIQRPLSYLQNNEEHDACMLVAAHANAMEWDLYTGDRAIVDTLLNKPMIVLPEPKKVRWGARWFRYANIIQLAAMTFVTAQKGWDGVCLVFLIIIHYALSRLFSGDALVSDWLDREHVDVTIKRFEFSGRNRMIGAIQVFSGTKIDRWMDEILVPHPRRDFWLDILKLPKGQAVKYPDDFTEHDKERVEGDAAAAHEAANILKRDMSTSNDGSDHSPPGTP
ncbi:MAG: hypothetical protein LQ346_003722 [Caloplaca aetnensis]|nr:MAG: hypothetical protein LQ346_003722 [Caloplaca aetnensis]